MTALLAIALLATPALAQDDDPDTGNRERVLGQAPEPVKPWRVDPYWEPISDLAILFGKDLRASPLGPGVPSVMLVAGVAGGVKYKSNGELGLYGYSRAEGEFVYSITHGGFGLAGRVGTFFGLDEELYRVTSGPDFFFDVYSQVGYELPAAPGMGWNVRATAKPLRQLWFTGSVTPLWIFTRSNPRASGPGFHELRMRLDAEYFGEFRLKFGWQWFWYLHAPPSGFQHVHGPVISAQF